MERALSAARLGALLLICLLALREGVRATGDLDWPGDPDLFRDIAQSQTFLQGNWDGDPFYKHAKLWYSPLVPAAIASGSRLTDSPPHELYARAGAYLNLIAPVSFFVLVAEFFNPGAALAATFAFVFLSGQDLPAFASATYSPWLFPGLFAQSLFFVSLVLLKRACDGTSTARYVLAGLSCGVTFLAHAAPAALLVAIVASIAVRARRSESRTGALPWLALGLSAVAVSLPLLWTIAIHYGLATRNPVPAGWQWPLLRWSELGRFVTLALSWASVVAVVGVIGTWRGRKGSFEARIMWVWAAVSFVFIGYGYLTPLLGKWSIVAPRFLPSHHFVFYAKALESIFFGVGLAAICRYGATWLERRFAVRLPADALVTAAVVALVALHYPSYRERPDFTLSRRKAELVEERHDRLAAFAWIETHTRPDDVFLCEDDLGLYVVAPAGRKVVATDRFFTNPYLDWDYRDRRRKRMFHCLATADEPCFRTLALAHEVSYVIVEAAEIGPLDAVSFLERVFELGRVQIYGVRREAASKAVSSVG